MALSLFAIVLATTWLHVSCSTDVIDAMLRNYQVKMMKALDGQQQWPESLIGPPVWVGDAPPPPFDQDVMEDDQELTDAVAKRNNDDVMDAILLPPGHHHHHKHHPAHRLVRSRQEPLSEEICKTHRYWKQVNETRDIYGQQVRVSHTAQFRQFAFVYECSNEGLSCSGITQTMMSTCEMRPGWAQMLHVKLNEETGHQQGPPQWGYVAVPHHCACRIYPRANPFARR